MADMTTFPLRSGPRLCLIVDDSQRIREDARAILEPMGFFVAAAASGEEGLDMCRQKMPETILLDWMMPGMNGLEFIRVLRSLPGGEAVAVIFCSAHDRPADIHKAMQAGASDFLLKPFTRELMAFKLGQAGLLAA